MFWLGKALGVVLSPTALMIECAVLGLLLGRRRGGFALRLIGIGALAACLLLPVEGWVVRPLEDRFPAVTTPPAHVDGIIVLGGAIDDITSKDRGTPTLNGGADRMTTFVILARRYPAAKLVFTGGSGSIEQGISTEAEYARMLFAQLGLPPDRVVYEDASRTTLENAVNTLALMHPTPGQTWVLLTSAAHMPRSVGVFRKVGWSVLPWPVGYQTRDRITVVGQSVGNRLSVLDWGVHEWTGLLVYWLRGWTDALFPAPAPGQGG